MYGVCGGNKCFFQGEFTEKLCKQLDSGAQARVGPLALSAGGHDSHLQTG